MYLRDQALQWTDPGLFVCRCLGYDVVNSTLFFRRYQIICGSLYRNGAYTRGDRFRDCRSDGRGDDRL